MIAVTEVARSRSKDDEVTEGESIKAAIESEVRVTQVGSFWARTKIISGHMKKPIIIHLML